MSLLAASCVNVAIGLFQSGEVAESIPYFWTARVLGGPASAQDPTPALLSQLSLLIERALAEADTDSAERLDSLIGIFDPACVGRLTREQAERRSLARCNDAAAALGEAKLERAAAFCLAAAASDPDGGLTQRYRDLTLQGLLDRRARRQAEGAMQEATLALAIAVALGARGERTALMDLLEPLGDFETVERLCVGIADDAEVAFPERHAAYLRGRRAVQRRSGRDAAAVEALAQADACDWLEALGPSDALDTEALSQRVALTLGRHGYRQAIEDLRELRRRRPDDPWVAHNLCSTIHNILDPDVADAAPTALAAVTDDPEDIEQTYAFMWSMGATPQALELARRMEAHKPEYAAIPDLHRMANDLDAAPVLVMGERRPGLPPLYANLVCWGERYLDLMEEAAIASLLADGNFPALAQKADVVLELYTTPADVGRLARSVALRRLSAYCEIRLYRLPDQVALHARYLGYATLGYANHATILRAERDGAGITFLLPDVLYADGCYAAIAERLTDRPYAAFSDGINAFRAPVLAAMKPFIRDGILSAPPAAVTDAGARAPTLRTTHSFLQPGDRAVCAYPTRVIFPMAEGLRSHAFMMLPAYVSHAAFAPMKIKSYGTMDGVFSEHVLNQLRDEEIEVIAPPEFSFVELCDDDGNYAPMLDKSFAEGVRDYFVAGCFNRRRHRLFRRPILFPTLSPPPYATPFSADEVAARLNEVDALFAHDPLLVDIDSAHQRIRELHYPRAATPSR